MGNLSVRDAQTCVLEHVLIRDTEVVKLEASLGQHLKDVNATLDPHEQLACAVVMTTAWTVDNDIITPTFKVKRNRIEELYSANYEVWESSRRKVIWYTN